MNVPSWRKIASCVVGVTVASYIIPTAPLRSTIAASPTVPPSCSLQKISKKTFPSLSLNGDGSRLAVATFSSKQKKGRQSLQEPSYTEEFSIFDTQRRKQRTIAKDRYEGRGRIPSLQISVDGTRVVFSSGGDFTHENLDGNLEIFLFNTVDRSIRQITKTTEGYSSTPTISVNGEYVAFLSTSTTDVSLPTTLILVNLATGVETKVAQPLGASSLISGASISGDGSKLVFASNVDLVETNPDGTEEVYLLEIGSQVVTQLTNTVSTETNSGNNGSPVISANGNRIVFSSVANLTGENPDGNFEIFLIDHPTRTITQITHTTGSSGLYGYNSSGGSASISADGTRIVFEGDKDLLKGDIDNISTGNDSEIFLFDTRTATLTQLTDSNGTSRGPVISADGLHMAFTVTPGSGSTILVGADLAGYNHPRRFRSKQKTTNTNPDKGTYLLTCP